LTDLDGSVDVDSWSPDGRVLAVHHHPPQGNQDILMIPMAEPNRKPEPFLVRGFQDEGSTFSPDGRYVAYVSGEAGQNEVQIRPYPGPGGQVTVSVGGGTKPVWTANGELFYRNLAGDRMMSVSLATEPALMVGPPQVVFQERYPLFPSLRADYDVTDDGKRFLMVTDGTTPAAPRINIVLNWFEELKARLPVP
jgi:serine/threonine-protein kinase